MSFIVGETMSVWNIRIKRGEVDYTAGPMWDVLLEVLRRFDTFLLGMIGSPLQSIVTPVNPNQLQAPYKSFKTVNT